MKNTTLPIELPDNAIKEFQDLMEKHYGLKPSFEKAKQQAKKFIKMFSIISQPIPKGFIY